MYFYVFTYFFSYSTSSCVVSENITVNIAAHVSFARITSKSGNIKSCVENESTVLCLLNLGSW